MKIWLAAALVVAVVLGGAWIALAFAFSHSSSRGEDAYARSAACLRTDSALSADPADARRLRTPGVRTLGLRWNRVRAVALFSDSRDLARKAEERLAFGYHREGLAPAQIEQRLQIGGSSGLVYLTGAPTSAAEAAIGRCVYAIHYNRIARFFGLSIFPRVQRPFLPDGRREAPPVT
jgi:hypothetical protein